LALVAIVVCFGQGCLKQAGELCGNPGPACSDAVGYECYVSPLPDTPLIFVNPLALLAGADGTLVHPYPTINGALEAASKGDTLVLAAGIYEESVRLEEQVDLAGAGPLRTTISSSDDQETLALAGADGITVAGIALRGNGGLGLLVHNCSGATIRDTDVSGQSSGTDYPGVGVYVLESSNVSLNSLSVSDNFLYGVVVSGSEASVSSSSVEDNGSEGKGAGIVVSDGSTVTIGPEGEPAQGGDGHGDVTDGDAPSSEGKADSPGTLITPDSAAGALELGGCVVADTDGIGILVQQARISISQSAVINSSGGGIALDRATLDPGTADSLAGSGSQISNVLVEDSKTYGIAQFGGYVTVSDSKVRGVYSPDSRASSANIAHGISVTWGDEQTPQFEISDSAIEDCGGAGILLDGASSGSWTGSNSLIHGVDVSATSLSGIWVQGSSRADVLNCAFYEVELVGLAYTGDSEGLAFGNEFVSIRTGMKPDFDLNKDIEMADAIYLSRLSQPNSVAVQENTILEAERNGVIVDKSSASAFFYAAEDGGQAVSSFSGNVVAQGAIVNGDEFAFQTNCVGFDDKTIAALLLDGASFVDPLTKEEVKKAPCVGKATAGTVWETATDFDVDG